MSPQDAPTGPSFAATVGASVLTVLQGVGRRVAAGYHAVDPAARRHLAQMPVMALTLLGPRRPTVEPKPDDGSRPLILVHGLGGHPGNFAPMRAWLRLSGSGRSRTYAFGYPDGDRSLGDLADELSAFVGEVIDRNDLGQDAQVDVVAHSMGGVVARLALRRPATSRAVRTLVTLGSPHMGTHAARYASTIHTVELRPGSVTMDELAHQVPWPAALPRLVCFWSPDDLFMLPATAAVVPGAESRRMEGFTHLSYLLHPECFAQVHEVLTA